MAQKFDDFSVQEAMRIASSPAGQRLLAMLRQTDSAKLQQAVKQATTGEYAQAQQTISELLSAPQVQEALKEMNQ